MLSEHANKIIKDIDNVRKEKKDIDCLLQKYHEKSEIDFIQKYAETEIGYSSKKLAWLALLLSLVALIIGVVGTLGLSLFLDNFKPYLNLFAYIIIIYSIALFVILYIFIKDLFFSGKDIFKEIIIEIEAINMQNNMQTKLDALEKKVSNKIENDFRIDVQEEKYWITILAFAALVFAVYPMVKDLHENLGKSESIMLYTLFFSFVFMLVAQLYYTKYFKHRP